MKKEKILFKFNKTASPVAYCILSTGFGTRNENPKFNGLAHLTEHMLFKGTPGRSSVNISSTLEKVGGDLNAYTTKERIVLYATILKEDIKKAVALIFEIAFASAFPPDELRKEKSVVYDEIITYQDSPTELLFDTFENELFAGSPLGYSILGDRKTLEPITSELLKRNLAKFFVPENMSLVIAGNFDEGDIKALVEKELQKWREGASLNVLANGETASLIPLTSREFASRQCDTEKELSFGKHFDKVVDKKLRQAHCIIGCSAYSYYNHRKRAALSLITNILGGPASNSRLSMSLREKNALVYHVEASCMAYKDTGSFSIYFGCEKDYMERCIRLIRKELDRFIDEPLSVRALAAAKKQMIGQISIVGDNVEAQSLTMGKSMLLTGRFISPDDVRADIEAVTAEQVQEVAKEILQWGRMSRLVFE